MRPRISFLKGQSLRQQLVLLSPLSSSRTRCHVSAKKEAPESTRGCKTQVLKEQTCLRVTKKATGSLKPSQFLQSHQHSQQDPPCSTRHVPPIAEICWGLQRVKHEPSPPLQTGGGTYRQVSGPRGKAHHSCSQSSPASQPFLMGPRQEPAGGRILTLGYLPQVAAPQAG